MLKTLVMVFARKLSGMPTSAPSPHHVKWRDLHNFSSTVTWGSKCFGSCLWQLSRFDFSTWHGLARLQVPRTERWLKERVRSFCDWELANHVSICWQRHPYAESIQSTSSNQSVRRKVLSPSLWVIQITINISLKYLADDFYCFSISFFESVVISRLKAHNFLCLHA